MTTTIFALDNIITVEFLRGGLSETRFFKNSDWNAQRLFDSKKLTIAEIRAIPQLEVHDHLDFWQYFCEKMLRTKFKITPNAGINKFAGLSRELGLYSETLGLSRPIDEMIQKRIRSLESWIEKFWTSEVETGKFGEQKELDHKSTLYLSKALMAKQLGNQDDFKLYIEKAAKQGSSEAMWQYGKVMLLGSKSDANSRKKGQDWVSKAASKGHKEAVATADRFAISY